MIKHYLQGVILKANAKLNISLCIDAKMSDNFHQIRTVICPISLSDSVEVKIFDSKKTEIKVTTKCDEQLLISNAEIQLLNSEKNLAYKAAILMLEEYEKNHLVEIDIKKSIPTKAGLGGGSSDAAAVLLGLNKIINNTELLSPKIFQIASKLGSDVVSQLFGKIIFCYGKGDKFKELKIHPESDFVSFLKSFKLLLLKPRVGVDTAWAYSLLSKNHSPASVEPEEICRDMIYENSGIATKEFITDFRPKASTLELFSNDFDLVVRDNVCEVDQAFQILNQYEAKKVMLAGSGSTVFGIFDKNRDLAEISKNLQNALGTDWFIKQSHFIGF